MRAHFGRAIGVPGSPSALQHRQLVSQDDPNGPKSSLAFFRGCGFLREPLPLFLHLQNIALSKRRAEQEPWGELDCLRGDSGTKTADVFPPKMS